MRQAFALRLSALLLVLLATAGPVRAQCVLANPSFEVPGMGGAVFAGWNQFGVTGSSPEATHGAISAKLTGPNLGGWDVSGYWQRMNTEPSEQWSATVCAWHAEPHPLSGQSRAIVNIEWRDAAGVLLSYESHTVADASTPVDEVQTLTVVSQAAPAGTAATHFLLGVLQAPGSPTPDVFFDQAVFEMIGPPTPEDLQWIDFPGGRTLDFSGRTWRVKGPGFYGPGPNNFCDGANCTWVDASGRLHMTVQDDFGFLASSEIALEEPLGYGDYIFTTVGRLDLLDPTVILGLFLWRYTACFEPANGWWNPNDEVDIEFSRWGVPGSDLGQFVVQPWDTPGNLERYDVALSEGEVTSHAFRWLSDRLEFRSWRGGSTEEATSPVIHTWTYSGIHLPRPERPRVHINLWHIAPGPATDQEVVLDEFRFEPAFVPPTAATPIAATSPASGLTVTPNPFDTWASIRFSLEQPGPVSLIVYDVRGRRVQSLVDHSFSPGEHQAHWDGLTEAGQRVPSGVYFLQLRTPGTIETRRVVLIK